PELTGSNPDSARSSVVLPAPLGPSKATTSPAAISIPTPCSTRILPYPDSSPLTESRGSAAEVSTDHLLVNANLSRGAGGKRTPEIEHGDLMADVEDQVGMVLDQQHAGAAGADRLDQPGQSLDLVVGKAGGGFVEQQEIRIEHQRAGDLDEA